MRRHGAAALAGQYAPRHRRHVQVWLFAVEQFAKPLLPGKVVGNFSQLFVKTNSKAILAPLVQIGVGL